MKYYPPRTVIDGIKLLDEYDGREFEARLDRHESNKETAWEFFPCKALAAICNEIRFFHPGFFGTLKRKWREEYDDMAEFLGSTRPHGYIGYFLSCAFAWRLWDELEAIRNENIPDASEDEADEAEEKTRAAA